MRSSGTTARSSRCGTSCASSSSGRRWLGSRSPPRPPRLPAGRGGHAGLPREPGLSSGPRAIATHGGPARTLSGRECAGGLQRRGAAWRGVTLTQERARAHTQIHTHTGARARAQTYTRAKHAHTHARTPHPHARLTCAHACSRTHARTHARARARALNRAHAVAWTLARAHSRTQTDRRTRARAHVHPAAPTPEARSGGRAVACRGSVMADGLTIPQFRSAANSHAGSYASSPAPSFRPASGKPVLGSSQLAFQPGWRPPLQVPREYPVSTP
jgi:hypothetical protein